MQAATRPQLAKYHSKRRRDMEEDNQIPFMQKVLDNHFLLLFLGVAVPTVIYIIWGIVDIISIPLAK
jgi:hypothetical protein